MLRLVVIPTLVALGLVAGVLTSDSGAQQFALDFPKVAGQPASCLTQEAERGGYYLRCPIVIPASVPAGVFIRAVVFRCMPDGAACQATYECSSGGPCDKHPNPVEPVAYNLQNLRTVTWWGWTGDPRDATLHFDIVVGP